MQNNNPTGIHIQKIYNVLKFDKRHTLQYTICENKLSDTATNIHHIIHYMMPATILPSVAGWKISSSIKNIGYFRYFRFFHYISDIFDIFILQHWIGLSTERLVFKLHISEWGY